MNSRPVLTTFTRFTLRFAALIALTVIVLASASVSESRDGNSAAPDKTANGPVQQSETVANSPRNPLQYAASPH